VGFFACARRQSILLDKLNFKRSCWEGISEEAKDFVALLLNKDPAKRPSAKQALRHPWLQGSVAERSTGRPLSLKVVQRIQVSTHNFWA
jgi:calcium-dependent protein kinase